MNITDRSRGYGSARKPQVVGKLPVARLLLGEQLQRIEEPAVGEHFVVQVIAGGAPGGAEAADDVSAFDAARPLT